MDKYDFNEQYKILQSASRDLNESIIKSSLALLTIIGGGAVFIPEKSLYVNAFLVVSFTLFLISIFFVIYDTHNGILIKMEEIFLEKRIKQYHDDENNTPETESLLKSDKLKIDNLYKNHNKKHKFIYCPFVLGCFCTLIALILKIKEGSF